MRLLLMTLTGALVLGCLSRPDTRPPKDPLAFAYTEVGDVRVHYREISPEGGPKRPEGTTDTVLFIHGYAGGLVSWHFAQPALMVDGFRTISFDLKGFGLTDMLGGDYSAKGQAALAVGLMDKLGVKRAHLVAHSYGCAVALEMALSYPERVDRVVLASAFVYPEQQNGFLRWSKVPVVGEILFGLFYDQQLETRYTWSYFEPSRHVPATAFDYLVPFQARPGVTAAALDVLRQMDLEGLQPRLATLKTEILLVFGAEDKVAEPRFGERLATDLPKARLVVLGRSGHSVMVERAFAFHELAREFFARGTSLAGGAP